MPNERQAKLAVSGEYGLARLSGARRQRRMTDQLGELARLLSECDVQHRGYKRLDAGFPRGDAEQMQLFAESKLLVLP